MPDNSYVLKIIAGPLVGQVFPVDGTVSIGRWATDIVIQDEKLSRTHASLDVEGHALVVRDHDSTNGTLVNGLRISGPMPVGDGDILTLGETQIEVSIPWAGDGEGFREPPRTEELQRPVPVVVSGVAKPRGLGIVAAAVVIAVGLGAAALAFFSSEETANNDKANGGDAAAQEGIGPPAAKTCERAAREARRIEAGTPAPRSAWIKEIRKARRLRARTLAVLVARGLAEERPAFVATFRRTDSSLLRLQNALTSRSKPEALNNARREMLVRARNEARIARRVELPDCGKLAI